MKSAYFAFDVGKTGGYAVIFPTDGVHQEKVELGIMPLIGKGKGADYDLTAIKNLLITADVRVDRLLVGIEDVHAIAGTGAGSNFQFGRGLGILEGLVSGLDIPYVKIFSKTWQKIAFEGVPLITKVNKQTKTGFSSDTKAMAKIAAARLYPQVDLRKSDRAELPHDGIVDALMIANYMKVSQL